jgi:MFS transporter, DHA1 family, multidrug resistance protein
MSAVHPLPASAAARVAPPLWLLVFITLSGTLGMHMFVPALPSAARDLGTGIAAMQLTISLYIAGLAVGQLIYGPLSDAFGRRRLLLGGLALYTVAGVAALFATGAHALIAARLLQALGGCSGLVLGRAIVRDTASTGDAVRKLATLNLMIILGPGLAPVIGGAVAEYLGWRWIFAMLAGLGLFAWICTARLMPETGQPTGRISAAILVNDYRVLLRSPVFVGFAVGGGCSTTAIYGFLATAPFIFASELHRPSTELGLYLALVMAGVSVGNALAARLSRSIGVVRVLSWGNLLSVVGAAAVLGMAWSGHLGVVPLMTAMIAFAIGAGASSPVALTKAISVNPLVTGSAAGLYGFSQMAIGAICTALVSLGHDPALAAGTVLLVMAILGRSAFTVAIRQERLGLSAR